MINMINLNFIKSALYLKTHIKLFITTYALIFLTTQTGLANLDIPIKGKVKSYSNGVYTIHTSRSLVYINDKKLTLELKRILHRRVGRQVQVTVPHYAISYQPTKSNKSSRTPANAKKHIKKFK